LPAQIIPVQCSMLFSLSIQCTLSASPSPCPSLLVPPQPHVLRPATAVSPKLHRPTTPSQSLPHHPQLVTFWPFLANVHIQCCVLSPINTQHVHPTLTTLEPMPPMPLAPH
jgi:hypothetical protein